MLATSRMFVSRALAAPSSRSIAAATTASRFFHASPQAAAKLNVEGLAKKVKLQGQNVLVRADLNVPLDKLRCFLLGYFDELS